MRGHGGKLSSTRGVGLFFFAISLVVIVGMAGLVIDLGMLLRTRAEAQRAADAAALAGASAFADYPPLQDPTSQTDTRARAVAAKNTMVGVPIDPAAEVIEVLTCQNAAASPAVSSCDSVMTQSGGTSVPAGTARVRVTVRRNAVPTVFARVFGVNSFPIGAKAVAEVAPAGAAKCVQPVLAPDFWDDKDDDSTPNRWPDKNEAWQWGIEDVYLPGDPTTGSGTGLGSDFRDGTFVGDAIVGDTLYVRDVGRPFNIWKGWYTPSFDNLWCPGDPAGSCGGDQIDELIQNPCSNVDKKGTTDVPPSQLGVEYKNKPGGTSGNVVGTNKKGYEQRLKATDPTGASWVPTSVGSRIGSDNKSHPVYSGYVKTTSGDWRSSPRVLLIPLMDPRWLTPGREVVEFNNFAWFWLESTAKGSDQAVFVRFIGLAAGGLGGGNTTSPLFKAIRLVR